MNEGNFNNAENSKEINASLLWENKAELFQDHLTSAELEIGIIEHDFSNFTNVQKAFDSMLALSKTVKTIKKEKEEIDEHIQNFIIQRKKLKTKSKNAVRSLKEQIEEEQNRKEQEKQKTKNERKKGIAGSFDRASLNRYDDHYEPSPGY